MGTNADLPCNNHSPRDGPTPRDGPNSPQSHRASNNTRNLSSPWTHVVRGGSTTSINEREAVPTAAATTTTPPPSSLSVADIPLPDPAPEPAYSPEKPLPPGNAVAEALTESSDKAAQGSSNAARAMKKQAWNRPSNGVIDAGPVMGDNWPALSESARASAKSSDSLKAPSDGSVPVSISPGPVIASSPHKPTTNNANPNLTPNHAFPARHKPAKRGSGGGGGMGPANNGSFMPPPVETPHSASDKVVAAEVVLDSSPRDPPQKNSNWETGPRGPFIPQPHIGTDQPRSSSRRGNGGLRGGGDGNYHSNYMNRREQERPSYEWNHPQSFSGRDAPMRQQRVVPRNFIRPPPPAPAPFASPPPIRPYGGPMGFPDLSSPPYYIPVPPPESLRGAPFVAHPGPPAHVFFPPLDSQLRTMLVKQIDYYFSSENLCKDLYLRRNMDEHGWVPISLIANFNRVKQITNSIQFILDTVRMSTIVEVQGEKIRKRNDWMTWILPPTNQSAASSGPLSPGISNYDVLATGMQNIGLEEWTGNNNSMNGPMHPHPDGVLTRSSSGESNSQSQVAMPTGTSNGEGMGQTIAQVGSDRPTSMRS
ncbi:la-related protein 1C-like [Magnolia sinica]|uniref:la-related protein 1C-like n=1 Tax=Magnolia sinica TaxID=86752 RepID=UPI00265836D9|nr:la-related protein 1C-like [Magnolia sinica]